MQIEFPIENFWTYLTDFSKLKLFLIRGGLWEIENYVQKNLPKTKNKTRSSFDLTCLLLHIIFHKGIVKTQDFLYQTVTKLII